MTSPPSLSVYPVSENQLQSNQAYVLFYQRKNSTVRKWDSASQSDQPYQIKHATFQRIGEAVLKCLYLSTGMLLTAKPQLMYLIVSAVHSKSWNSFAIMALWVLVQIEEENGGSKRRNALDSVGKVSRKGWEQTIVRVHLQRLADCYCLGRLHKAIDSVSTQSWKIITTL